MKTKKKRMPELAVVRVEREVASQEPTGHKVDMSDLMVKGFNDNIMPALNEIARRIYKQRGDGTYELLYEVRSGD